MNYAKITKYSGLITFNIMIEKNNIIQNDLSMRFNDLNIKLNMLLKIT